VAALKDVVVAPVVRVWITKTPPIRVSVVGEVKTAGPQEMTRDRTLLAALAQAGWLTEFAHTDRVFVVRARSNERIRFRVRDITEAEPHAARFQLADGDVVVVE
jgi:polysaccharide export outer membrane protein